MGREPRPRSRVVEAIAVLLLARPMRAAEIAQALGYPVNYVTSYLSYWRVRGLFEYENGFWRLTERGVRFAQSVLEREVSERVSQYVALARSILGGEQVGRAANREGGEPAVTSSSGAQRFTAARTGAAGGEPLEGDRLVCAEALLEALDLTEEEREVLDQLLTHYLKWGTTYTYVEALEEALSADRAWLLRVLRSLQSKGLIYIYSDRRLGVRVGLSRRVKAYMERCAGGAGRQQ